MKRIELTQENISRVLNEAADEIIEAADLPDSGARDALNLLVNLVGHRLFENPEAELEEAIEASYSATPREVLDWCAE